MTEIGYWASQEQYSMQQLIDFVKEAERAGFESTLTSDIFIHGRIQMDMEISHGSGFRPSPKEQKK